MFGTTRKNGQRTSVLVASMILIALLSVGCKKKSSKSAAKAEASASASASASGSAAPASTLAGPCGDLQTKICAAAGSDSALCTNATESYGVLSDAACAAAVKDFAHTEQKIKDQRKSCDELVETLCSAIGKDTDTCKMVREKTPQFPPERCKMMLGKKDAVIADLKRQEMANKPLSKELQEKVAAADAPSFGPADAKVTIVEFSDFQCPYCARAADVTHKVREKYGDKVHFVFRNFPLSFHQNAKPAAKAAMAAHAQGKFWEFHDKLFANQQKLDQSSFDTYAQEAGLDVAKFHTAQQDSSNSDRIESDMKLGEEVAVQGTPTMFVNGERVPNPTDFSAVSQMIEKLLGS
jgi:protein-disulfide isomerase